MRVRVRVRVRLQERGRGKNLQLIAIFVCEECGDRGNIASSTSKATPCRERVLVWPLQVQLAARGVTSAVFQQFVESLSPCLIA